MTTLYHFWISNLQNKLREKGILTTEDIIDITEKTNKIHTVYEKSEREERKKSAY